MEATLYRLYLQNVQGRLSQTKTTNGWLAKSFRNGMNFARSINAIRAFYAFIYSIFIYPHCSMFLYLAREFTRYQTVVIKRSTVHAQMNQQHGYKVKLIVFLLTEKPYHSLRGLIRRERRFESSLQTFFSSFFVRLLFSVMQ